MHPWNMEKLNELLAAYVARGKSTKYKVLGAAFTVVNKDGESSHATFEWHELVDLNMPG